MSMPSSSMAWRLFSGDQGRFSSGSLYPSGLCSYNFPTFEGKLWWCTSILFRRGACGQVSIAHMDDLAEN